MKKTTAFGRKLKRSPARPHPLIIAVVRSQIRRSIEQLTTSASLHGMIGENPAMVANQAGRLCFIVCHAASACGYAYWPEVSILRGLAESLGDIVASPSSLERLRGSINSGIAAAQRLLPKLDDFALAMGSLELDTMLTAGQGMGTSDIEKILRQQPAVEILAGKRAAHDVEIITDALDLAGQS